MRRFLFVIAMFLLGCGASSKSTSAQKSEKGGSDIDLEVKYSAQDFNLRAALERSELTTAVDERRYRAAAEVKSDFSAKEPIIYFVGKLRKVPTDAEIEVRWFIEPSQEPMFISTIRGSETFQFIASFKPAQGKFERGSYTARVYINDREIGSVPFTIFDDTVDQRGAGISRIALSTGINRTNLPKNEDTQFKKGVKRIYLSFDAIGIGRGIVADIEWSRGSELFHDENVVLEGDHRYSTHIESENGLPPGSYRVEISIGGSSVAGKSFVIGKPSSGPTIEKVSLGLDLDSSNFPTRETRTFEADCTAIYCGLQFLDLNPNSIIEIQWIQIDNGDELLRYKNRSELPSGGAGTMSASWQTKYEFEKGRYKLVVLINGEAKAEQIFEIR